MAAYAEITIEQGATFSTTVNVTDAQGDALNLFSYSAASQMRKSYYASSANTLSAIVTGNANGEITLSMSSANTSGLTPGRYVYDLRITNSIDGTVTRVIEGTAVVMPSVTR